MCTSLQLGREGRRKGVGEGETKGKGERIWALVQGIPSSTQLGRGMGGRKGVGEGGEQREGVNV